MQKYDVSADRARTPPEGTSTVDSEVDFLIANTFVFYQHVPMQDRTRECCTEIAGFQGESNRLVKVEDVHLLNRLGRINRVNKNKHRDRSLESLAY